MTKQHLEAAATYFATTYKRDAVDVFDVILIFIDVLSAIEYAQDDVYPSGLDHNAEQKILRLRQLLLQCYSGDDLEDSTAKIRLYCYMNKVNTK